MRVIGRLFKSAFHPAVCAVCGRLIAEGETVCDYCGEMLVYCDPLKRCIRCGMDKKACQCRHRVFHFDGCIAPFVNTGAARKAAYAFKFRRRTAVADFFARQMAICVKNEYRDIRFDCVSFVPMYALKKLKRGFNQSEILADRLGSILSLPVRPLLKCLHSGRDQHLLAEKERFENVRGLYSVKGPAAGKTVLLVDDIKTTGATLDECARQLLLSGADSVYCVSALISGKSNKSGKTAETVLK